MKRSRGPKRPLKVTILPAEKQLDTQQVIRILLRGAEYRPIMKVPAHDASHARGEERPDSEYFVKDTL